MATKTTTESARNDIVTARTPCVWTNRVRTFTERNLWDGNRSRMCEIQTATTLTERSSV